MKARVVRRTEFQAVRTACAKMGNEQSEGGEIGLDQLRKIPCPWGEDDTCARTVLETDRSSLQHVLTMKHTVLVFGFLGM